MSQRNEFYANLKLQPMEQAKSYQGPEPYRMDGTCYGYKPTKPMSLVKALVGITLAVVCAVITGCMLAGVQVL